MGYINIVAQGPHGKLVRITDSDTGEEIKNVRSIDFHWTPESVLTVNLEIYGHVVEAQDVKADLITICPNCSCSYVEAKKIQEGLVDLQFHPISLHPELERQEIRALENEFGNEQGLD